MSKDVLVVPVYDGGALDQVEFTVAISGLAVMMNHFSEAKSLDLAQSVGERVRLAVERYLTEARGEPMSAWLQKGDSK